MSEKSPTLSLDQNLKRRRRIDRAFKRFIILCTGSCVVLLMILLADVAYEGFPWLTWDFMKNFPSRFPAKAGIKAAFFGTLWVISLTAAISIPLGVGASIYLEEFARKNWWSRFIQLNIANLAGVPSIVYGMLGLVAFVRGFNLPPITVPTISLVSAFPFVDIGLREASLALDRSVLAGALTLSLLILPVIILSAREALKAVPPTLRQASLGLGATKWQTVRDHVLPAALPGILTGVILAISRAIGETAPLIMIGALTYVAFTPENIFDGFTAMPIQIFNWASRPQHDFHSIAAAGIVVLLAMLLAMNSIAIFIRHRFQRKIKW